METTFQSVESVSTHCIVWALTAGMLQLSRYDEADLVLHQAEQGRDDHRETPRQDSWQLHHNQPIRYQQPIL